MPVAVVWPLSHCLRVTGLREPVQKDSYCGYCYCCVYYRQFTCLWSISLVCCTLCNFNRNAQYPTRVGIYLKHSLRCLAVLPHMTIVCCCINKNLESLWSRTVPDYFSQGKNFNMHFRLQFHSDMKMISLVQNTNILISYLAMPSLRCSIVHAWQWYCLQMSAMASCQRTSSGLPKNRWYM